MLTYRKKDPYKHLRIYKGGFNEKIKLNIPITPKIHKVIVFDLDETLGSFNELISIWISLEKIKELYNLPIDLSQDFFNKLLDLYPEFLRYGILTIFEFLQYKKNTDSCYKIYIYTNNIYSPTFPKYIKNYFHYKLNSNDLIDQVISAFKINNVIIEPMRTQNDKIHSDFIRCSCLPRNTEICFVDDSYYDDMIHKKIYYIQPKKYFHGLSYSQILNRFLVFDSAFHTKDIDNIANIISSTMQIRGGHEKPKSSSDMEIDIIVSQKLMYHIKEFFYLTTRKSKTKKCNLSLGRFTRKKC